MCDGSSIVRIVRAVIALIVAVNTLIILTTSYVFPLSPTCTQFCYTPRNMNSAIFQTVISLPVYFELLNVSIKRPYLISLYI